MPSGRVRRKKLVIHSTINGGRVRLLILWRILLRSILNQVQIWDSKTPNPTSKRRSFSNTLAQSICARQKTHVTLKALFLTAKGRWAGNRRVFTAPPEDYRNQYWTLGPRVAVTPEAWYSWWTIQPVACGWSRNRYGPGLDNKKKLYFRAVWKQRSKFKYHATASMDGCVSTVASWSTGCSWPGSCDERPLRIMQRWVWGVCWTDYCVLLIWPMGYFQCQTAQMGKAAFSLVSSIIWVVTTVVATITKNEKNVSCWLASTLSSLKNAPLHLIAAIL